jgi:hypothetical protein
MWRQLSGSEKFRFVCCVIGLPATVVSTTFTALGHHWFKAAIQAFLVFSFCYYLYKFATRGRESGNPTVLIGLILAVIVLATGSFFWYQQLSRPASPLATVYASDTSFTVSLPRGWGVEAAPVTPGWRTEDLERPHIASMSRLYLTSDTHDRDMNVVTQPTGSLTLQKWAQSDIYGVAHVAHAEIDRYVSLQPTTIGAEDALRTDFTVPVGPNIPTGTRGQEYAVIHRNIGYLITFSSRPGVYASAADEFDAVLQSWTWSEQRR